jgi:uncharacterized protein YecE (DUF72 family)
MSQLDLFGGPPPPAPFAHPEAVRQLGAGLPQSVHLGCSSWSYPGWAGHVYAGQPSESVLVSQGLPAYCQHPLLRSVSLDRTLYDPLPAADLRALAAQVPAGFRFWVKAHEHTTLARFPDLARWGERRNQLNARWLDPGYATDAVVAPAVEGLGSALGPILFQFTPDHASELPPPAFAERLYHFLQGLPKGPTYAVELRDSRLFLPIYAQALAHGGAVHCYTVHPAMPPLDIQRLRMPPVNQPALVLRWNLAHGHTFTTAGRAFGPYNRLQKPDLPHRQLIAGLCHQAAARGHEAHIVVSNHAEGCAPASVVELARVLANEKK